MKPLFSITLLLTSLAAWADDMPQQPVDSAKPVYPDELQVEVVSPPRDPERRLVRVAKPAIDPDVLAGVVGGIAYLWIDYLLEGDLSEVQVPVVEPVEEIDKRLPDTVYQELERSETNKLHHYSRLPELQTVKPNQ